MTSQYRCDFSIDGRRVTQIVAANNEMEAKRIIESQYRGCRIQWWNRQRLR